MDSGTSGFMPERLMDAIKGEVLSLQREERTRTFSVEFRVVRGVPSEARLRSHEVFKVVTLSS